MTDCNFANISAFEEDPSCDKLNQKTFDRVNDLDWVFGNFDFSNKLWTSRKVYNGKFYLPTYKEIGAGDFVCRCGETVYDDTLLSKNQGSLSRIYIPRVMTNKLAFYSDQEVKNFIFEQLSPFCNIRDIQLRWLDDAFDLSAFVYLVPENPLHASSLAKTTACNLSCKKCNSVHFQVVPNVFWTLLPSQCLGIMYF